MKFKKLLAITTALGALALTLSACSKDKKATNNTSDKISIVTSTNVYADIAKNVVGKYGTVSAIITNDDHNHDHSHDHEDEHDHDNSNPHDFEPTANDAKKLAKADIIVANGLGFDDWMTRLSSSVSKKPVLVGEQLMGLKSGDNPHIWYNLNMPKKYVNYLVKRLSKLDKKHAAYFEANGKKYLAKIAKLQKLAQSINGQNKKPVYVSEPVFDYALKEAGFKIGDKDFEEAIANGTDPSPKVVNQMIKGINNKEISFFVNNSQASSSTVQNFVKLAQKNNIPVLNVRETIPSHTSYLKWMTENYENLAKVAQE